MGLFVFVHPSFYRYVTHFMGLYVVFDTFDFRHIKAIVFHTYLIPKGWNTYRKHETQTKPNPALPWWYISPIPRVCSYLFILVFIDMSPIPWVLLPGF